MTGGRFVRTMLKKLLRNKRGLAAAVLVCAFTAGVILLQLAYFPPDNMSRSAAVWAVARIVGYALFWPSAIASAVLTSREIQVVIRGPPTGESRSRGGTSRAGSLTTVVIGLAMFVLFVWTFSAAIWQFCGRFW